MLTQGREKLSGLICSFFSLIYFLKLLSWARHHERFLGFKGIHRSVSAVQNCMVDWDKVHWVTLPAALGV